VEDRCEDGLYEFVRSVRINIRITEPPSLRRVEYSFKNKLLRFGPEGNRVTEIIEAI